MYQPVTFYQSLKTIITQIFRYFVVQQYNTYGITQLADRHGI